MTSVDDRAAAPVVPPPVRVPLFVVAVIAAVTAVVLGILFSGHTLGTSLDESVYRALHGSIEPPVAYAVAWVVGSAGDPGPAAVLVLLIAFLFRRAGQTRPAVLTIAGPVVTGVVTTVAKPIAGRYINGDNLSYPSGHTAFVTSIGVVLGLYLAGRFGLGRIGGTAVVLAPALLFAAAMSWSQVSDRVHYLTDTFGGFCVAVALVTAAGATVDAFLGRVKPGR
ncbi:phosphatase PAP2 family protein [Amycolatopsis sp. MEPSY49]|uniref:phosphatase PAP2 family protein n=1 Tax=Amycolatopsis sp. MEPSY49 TaxID=3151600 RepID=UPI003EF3F535